MAHRNTQDAVQLVWLNTPNNRTSQLGVQVIYQQSTALNTRLSQVPVQIVVNPGPVGRISQAPSQVVMAPTPKTRLSQLAIQVVIPFTDPSVTSKPNYQFVMT